MLDIALKRTATSSLKVKIFIYCLSFVLITLVFLWGMQTIFLDDFYQTIKMGNVARFSDSIGKVLENKTNSNLVVDKQLKKVIGDSDYYVTIYDDTGRILYQNNDKKINTIDDINDQQTTNKLYKKAKREQKGVTLVHNSKLIDEVKDVKILSYGKFYKGNGHQKYFVLINARLTILTEIAKTIVEQLIIVTCLMLLFTLSLTYFSYKKISKPIISLTDKAKEFSKGKFNVDFNVSGFSEVDELSNALAYAQSELAKIDQMRNDLISNVSHDFRTPLTMISGYAQMMLDLPNENNEENIKIIIEECNRLTRLVNDLLDLSKIKDNTGMLCKEVVSITDLCSSVVNRFNSLLEKDGYHVSFDYDLNVLIEADESRINQVIYNIIGNAIHYTGTNKRVTVRQIIKNDRVRIEIQDYGKGIKEEELPHIWNRYYRSDKVKERQIVGTGIGLSIVKEVLELHQAKYGVKSKVNEGSTFYFEFPIKEIL